MQLLQTLMLYPGYIVVSTNIPRRIVVGFRELFSEKFWGEKTNYGLRYDTSESLLLM